MTIYDSHLHLTRADLPRLAEWRAAGLAGLTCATAHYAEWPQAVAISTMGLPAVRVAIGIHPWYLPEAPESALQELDRLLAANAGLAIGEIGLDFTNGREDQSEQLRWCETQLALAARHRRPAVLHLRRAWDLAARMLEQYPEAQIVLHSYSGSGDVARELVKRLPNIYFSFGFGVCRQDAPKLSNILQHIPNERLMTDSDYPFQHLSENSESTPADLSAVIKRLAELRGEEPARLAAQIAENWRRVFVNGLGELP